MIGKYKVKAGQGWVAAELVIENSFDDDGHEADRPRLVLYVGSQRFERPDMEHWRTRLWPCPDHEHARLAGAHAIRTTSEIHDLHTARSLF